MVSIQKVLTIIVTVALLILTFICHNENITEVYSTIPILNAYS